MSARSLPRLLLITDRHRTSCRPIVDLVASAVDAGLRFVQVRERDLDDSAVAALLDAIVRSVPPDTRIAVNGRPALASALRLGLHLPAGAPLPDLAGIPFWGRSVHDGDELSAAIGAGASYVILGTLFPTPSKPGHPGGGLEWLRTMLPPTVDIPVFAIGGIDAPRAAAARAAGAYGVAVCGAILGAADPHEATAELIESVGSAEDSRPARR